MGKTTQESYELITAIPSSEAEMQAALEAHSLVLGENTAADTYDRYRTKAIALANLNQLFDGEVSETALAEARQSLGEFATAAA